jgi:hypothetical protein
LRAQLVGALFMYGCPSMVMALLFFPLISTQFFWAVSEWSIDIQLVTNLSGALIVDFDFDIA